MNRLKKLALVAALIGLLAEDEVVSRHFIKINDIAWTEACKELSPEDFYLLIKEYERKILNEWK